jgi:hypothetical protein
MISRCLGGYDLTYDIGMAVFVAITNWPVISRRGQGKNASFVFQLPSSRYGRRSQQRFMVRNPIRQRTGRAVEITMFDSKMMN